MGRTALALYGNISLVRAYCQHCKRDALVVHGNIQCCDRPFSRDPIRFTRMSEPEAVRKKPFARDAKGILERQEFKCLYCERAFDSYVYYRRLLKKIVIHWDHYLPYSYSSNNYPYNFVAACQFCNMWKGSKIFQTVDGVKVYVASKWEETERDSAPEV